MGNDHVTLLDQFDPELEATTELQRTADDADEVALRLTESTNNGVAWAQMPYRHPSSTGHHHARARIFGSSPGHRRRLPVSCRFSAVRPRPFADDCRPLMGNFPTQSRLIHYKVPSKFLCFVLIVVGTLPSTGVSEMAKKKVHPRPGALMELLKKREMTKTDAAHRDVTGVDRKTLGKINRGEEVKLETLHKVATRLRVPPAYFLETVEADDANDPSEPMHSVMLRKLNGERLAELLKDAKTIDWMLNVQVVDEKARKPLRELERAVRGLSGSALIPGWTDGLSYQLERLERFHSLSAILKELHECHLAVLAGDYVHWERSDNFFNQRFIFDYRSDRKILLSVEPASTHSRRVAISPGPEPPKFAPPAPRRATFAPAPLAPNANAKDHRHVPCVISNRGAPRTCHDAGLFVADVCFSAQSNAVLPHSFRVFD
jgi:hypothetical protein